MKKKILFLLLIASVSLFAQQKKYTIDWEGTEKLFGANFSIEVPSFNKENFTFNEERLVFVDQWETGEAINEASVSLSNVTYQTISNSELGDLNILKIPSELEFSLENSNARNKRYAHFQLSPIVKNDGGSFRKVTSFQINYTLGAAQKRSSSSRKNYRSSKVVMNSVLNEGEWYRFYIDTTGVFKLSKNFLEKLGVNVNSVNPRNIKLYGHGGSMIPYANSIPYPYDLPENAIKFVTEFVPTFKSATVGGPPLYGAQQIHGNDPNLRVGEVSFPSKSYARSEIIKASSALTVANQIIDKIQEEKIVPLIHEKLNKNLYVCIVYNE